MSVLDDPNEYKKNPLYEFHEPSDYSLFYVTLVACSFFATFLLVLNIYLCCFSKHRSYWKDPNTGNRWILPIFVKTPTGQTPLDLKELEHLIASNQVYETSSEFLELREKVESDI